MAPLPFNRLILRCNVRFGYLPPDELFDNVIDTNSINSEVEVIKKLIESIALEGVRNPLIANAYADKDTFITVGHHRLWAAKKAMIDLVPVIVNDWCNRYPLFENLNSIDEVRSKFKDQPNIVKSFTQGISTSEPLMNNESWWK